MKSAEARRSEEERRRRGEEEKRRRGDFWAFHFRYENFKFK